MKDLLIELVKAVKAEGLAIHLVVAKDTDDICRPVSSINLEIKDINRRLTELKNNFKN